MHIYGLYDWIMRYNVNGSNWNSSVVHYSFEEFLFINVKNVWFFSLIHTILVSRRNWLFSVGGIDNFWRFRARWFIFHVVYFLSTFTGVHTWWHICWSPLNVHCSVFIWIFQCTWWKIQQLIWWNQRFAQPTQLLFISNRNSIILTHNYHECTTTSRDEMLWKHCSRDQFKKVSSNHQWPVDHWAVLCPIFIEFWICYQVMNTSYKYFMTLRKFYEWIRFHLIGCRGHTNSVVCNVHCACQWSQVYVNENEHLRVLFRTTSNIL